MPNTVIRKTLRFARRHGWHHLGESPIVAGLFLILTALAAMVWANISPRGYYDFWHEPVLQLGRGKGEVVPVNLHDIVNDLLMALFFFFVGLEIKREIIAGELSTLKKAMMPLAAAIGGMVLPALLFVAVNWGLPSEKGWGIPMATDIAFSLGILALVGTRAPISLKVFLTALAIGDDLGAVVVIAVFYSSDIHLASLLIAGSGLLVMAIANAAGLKANRFYYLIGLVVVWTSFLISGVHATLAGVLVAFVFPASPNIPYRVFRRQLGQVVSDLKSHEYAVKKGVLPLRLLRRITRIGRLSVNAANPLQQQETLLHPYVIFFIMPVFALANAGVEISGSIIEVLTNPLSLGIILGLTVGKPVGIFFFSKIFQWTGLASLPRGVTNRQLWGVGFLAGVGFTMSLFITHLAFYDPAMEDAAKLAILLASFMSGIIGFLLLYVGQHDPTEKYKEDEVIKNYESKPLEN